MIGEELGAALDASEALADALMHTTATILDPTIGSLSRDDQTATTTTPAAGGAILNTW